jgi:hypothetical protein
MGSGSRDRSRERSNDRRRRRSRSRSRGRIRSRSRSRERSRHDTHRRHHSRSLSNERRPPPSVSPRLDEADKKAARLSKLQAWKQQQQQQQQQQQRDGSHVPRSNGLAPEQQERAAEDAVQAALRRAHEAAAAVAANLQTSGASLVEPIQPLDDATQPPSAKKVEIADAEVDPLDAFMDAEVLPEVAARENDEMRRQEEERRQLQELLSVSWKICQALLVDFLLHCIGIDASLVPFPA